ncbi:MAG: DegT/DnrJ/EryC1/StrS family aminotransferase [Candidatus Omnitrophica bacterium]|nr:DegT/DnrJ/EryC1/StrS family aminotransferase [Candidatus Omnitrophota bacterium]
MKIPLLDLKREYALLENEINKEIKTCLLSQNWILGETVSDFEDKVASYLGTKYAIGVASGTDALILSLRAIAMKYKKTEFFSSKDEIITTPFSFIATAEAIVRAGAKPVFVDIDPYTYNIDPQKVEKAINKNTVGILPVHLYGLSADMSAIMRLARKNKLFVLEDVAQAFGACCDLKNKQRLGSIGDCGAFSFFPSKNLGGYGDGGMISTNCQKIEKNLKVLRNHGQTKTYEASFSGYNSRLDALQAAILGVKLKKIDEFNDARRRVAKDYNAAFSKIKQITVPQGYDKGHIYHLYTIAVSSGRDKLLKYLNDKGVTARVYYPVLISRMKSFKAARVLSVESAYALSRRVISLPIHPFMKKQEADYVIKVVSDFF